MHKFITLTSQQAAKTIEGMLQVLSITEQKRIRGEYDPIKILGRC